MLIVSYTAGLFGKILEGNIYINLPSFDIFLKYITERRLKLSQVPRHLYILIKISVIDRFDLHSHPASVLFSLGPPETCHTLYHRKPQSLFPFRIIHFPDAELLSYSLLLNTCAFAHIQGKLYFIRGIYARHRNLRVYSEKKPETHSGFR